MALSDATSHRVSSSLNLDFFVHSLFAEHSEQHDALAVSEVERNSPCNAVKLETHLEVAVAERPRRGHTQRMPRSARPSMWRSTNAKSRKEIPRAKPRLPVRVRPTA